MAKRKDGQETKQKLLDVACNVFAERGFREAKITEICRRAGANVAAVNYYFGDKESLYVARLASGDRTVYHLRHPAPGRSASPKSRLRLAIYRLIEKTLTVR